MLEQKIKDLARRYAPEYVQVRRHLHAHPELSYQEYETSAFIQRNLQSLGIPFTVMAETGVVGILKGRNPEKRIVALRADIDALPIKEENDVPYRSTREGVMHACGHDVHSACLMGATRILNELKEEWEGTIKIIFQPGEEKNPGGASLMIAEGVLNNPTPGAIFGLHVHPHLETGRFSFRPGQVMASADEIYITIRGEGGHAAAPHLTADTIAIGSQLVVSLQQIISRHCNPFHPSVLSITAFQGGFTTNVIPSEVKLMGTFRALDETWRFKAHELIRREAEGLVKAMGAEIDLHIDVGYPSVYNHEELCAEARHLAELFAGAENIETTEMRMGAEDFGYYTRQIPGCFFRLGSGNVQRGISAGVHTPHFNIDEKAIEHGMGMMAWLGALSKAEY